VINWDPAQGLKKILNKNINVPMYGRGRNPMDIDGDGIINSMDCQPKNMFRQDTNTMLDKAGKKYYLSGREMSDFKNFFKKRFPKNSDPSYMSEWADRFSRSVEWRLADGESKRVLLSVNPVKYKAHMKAEKTDESYPVNPGNVKW